MQTNLADFIRETAAGQRADAILRSCVHCGFCTATCPTYQLLGDELDGPRGRIYLIKQVLEGEPASSITQTHLDRCLTCRNCETTCPSGVSYGELLDIGREVVEEQISRSLPEMVKRTAMRNVFSSPWLFGLAFALGRAFAPFLPRRLRSMLHAPDAPGEWPLPRHARRMVVLSGCVQPVLAPRINAAAARVLDRLGISLETHSGSACCGAVDHHMNAPGAALVHVRANVDAWHEALDGGAEAIVMTASGCGVMVKEYGRLLADDPAYAAKAKRVAAHTLDLGEVLSAEPIESLKRDERPIAPTAYHPPCTLQHGQRLNGQVESILRRLGVPLEPVRDAHLCCGSAGTYSVLQPALSEALRERKLDNLQAGEPAQILTSNVGCLHHLQAGTERPVHHWIEWLDEHSQ